MRTRAGFEDLLVHLEPWIVATSRLYCKKDPQGAAQEARSRVFIRVFKEKRVDLEQSSACIANLLRTMVRNVILNEVRRLSRDGMNKKGSSRDTAPRPELKPLSDGAHVSWEMRDTHGDSIHPFPIPQYAEYFAIHGTISGAAKWCEKRYGYDARKVEIEFKRVTQKFENLA